MSAALFWLLPDFVHAIVAKLFRWEVVAWIKRDSEEMEFTWERVDDWD